MPGGFLNLFGKPDARERLRVRALRHALQLGPVLNLVTGPVVGDAMRDPNNRIAKLLATEKDDRRSIEELYLAVLCRLPTAQGSARRACKRLKDGEVDFAALKEEAERRADALAAYEKTLPEK